VKTPLKIAAAAAGLLLAGGATAAAVTTPDAAEKGLTTATDHSGVTVPVGADGDHPESSSVETSDAAQGTHGAEVSAVANDHSTTGREHGEAVSTVARDGHGGGQVSNDAPVATPNTGGTGTADDASDGASDEGSDHAADQAAAGSENAGDHGRP
jgi:hypothetical protein